MLVAYMTDLEALNEVMDDLLRIQNRSQRWVGNYFKKRMRLRIPPHQSYLRTFLSKKKLKNQ
jgi:hypothetical protein